MNVLGKTEATTLSLQDILYVITGVGSSPLDQKAKLETLVAFLIAQNGLGNLYTNANPTPSTIGGIEAGSTFSAVTVQGMWDKLLYPYQLPSFSSFSFAQSNPLEVGAAVPSGAKNFQWTSVNPSNITPNSLVIYDVTSSNAIATGLADSGSYSVVIAAVTRSIMTSYVWQLRGTNTNNQMFSRNFIVNWLWAGWYGESGLATLSGPDVKALRVKGLLSTALGTYQFNTGGYKWFCWPSLFAAPTRFKDQATQLDVAMASPISVSVTNDFGITDNYNCYRTLNVLGGAITIVVS
jgi:hypothetical protein